MSRKLDVSLDDLPRLVFVDNSRDMKLALTMDNVENSRDLFQFLVNLLTRGIVLLYGRGSQSVSLDTLGAVEIETLKRKLSNAGIELLIDITDSMSQQLGVVFLVDEDNSGDLGAYRMRITDSRNQIHVGFRITRRGAAP